MNLKLYTRLRVAELYLDGCVQVSRIFIPSALSVTGPGAARVVQRTITIAVAAAIIEASIGFPDRNQPWRRGVGWRCSLERVEGEPEKKNGPMFAADD